MGVAADGREGELLEPAAIATTTAAMATAAASASPIFLRCTVQR